MVTKCLNLVHHTKNIFQIFILSKNYKKNPNNLKHCFNDQFCLFVEREIGVQQLCELFFLHPMSNIFISSPKEGCPIYFLPQVYIL